ncbi:MAG: glycosyltransferase [Candidatus Promineifilaceae bacterium]|nr:glycosyltransferase [Candidatus Promineifilaceae bacterium]
MKFVFFNIPTSGHVNPALALTAGLVEAGHEVITYLTPGYRDKVLATGSAFRAYPEDVVNDEYFSAVARRFNPPRLATILLDSARELLPQLRTDLEREQPAAVLYDSMCPWGRLAARAVSLPAVTSMTLLDLGLPQLIKSGFAGEALRLLIQNAPWMGRLFRAMWRLRRTHGLPVAPFPKVLNWAGDLTLVYTARRFWPRSDGLGDEYVFVGPPIRPRPDQSGFPFERLDPERSLLYVSLGTVFNDNPDFFRQCIAAFGQREMQVVMALGEQVQAADLGTIPDNIIVWPYVPQLEILPQTSLFITHGGMNSVHEGLYHDVPLLLVPQQVEQGLVAVRVAEMGAGLVLHDGRATAAQLRAASNQVLNEPGYRASAAELGAALRATGGVPRAVAAMETFVGRR